MKYKVGQKVKIRRSYSYRKDIIKILKKTDYILTISGVEKLKEDEYCYTMEETWDLLWKTDYILYPIQESIELINTRFEILDL